MGDPSPWRHTHKERRLQGRPACATPRMAPSLRPSLSHRPPRPGLPSREIQVRYPPETARPHPQGGNSAYPPNVTCLGGESTEPTATAQGDPCAETPPSKLRQVATSHRGSSSASSASASSWSCSIGAVSNPRCPIRAVSWGSGQSPSAPPSGEVGHPSGFFRSGGVRSARLP